MSAEGRYEIWGKDKGGENKKVPPLGSLEENKRREWGKNKTMQKMVVSAVDRYEIMGKVGKAVKIKIIPF